MTYKLAWGATLAALFSCGGAVAATQTVTFSNLTASATASTPLSNGDSLLVNTLVTNETGPLSETVTFMIASGVTGITGNAAWNASPAPGPRLTGVNIDIFNSANSLVVSDTFAGSLGSFAISTINSALTPGTYRLVATGTGVTTSSLDIAITAVPEPGTTAMLLAGLGSVVLLARRRRSAD
jgi:hypothetical protein